MGLVGGAVGAIGGILGIISWLTARRREKRVREEQDAMWQMYVDLKESSKTVPGASLWNFRVGSKEHKLAEMMVEKKLLDRAPRDDGYCLREALSESRYHD
jgi:hypothetical protein